MYAILQDGVHGFHYVKKDPVNDNSTAAGGAHFQDDYLGYSERSEAEADCAFFELVNKFSATFTVVEITPDCWFRSAVAEKMVTSGRRWWPAPLRSRPTTSGHPVPGTSELMGEP